MKFSTSLRVGSRTFAFSLASVDTPDANVMGMASRCNDGLHVTFLDYDKVYEEIVVEELEAIQERDKLGAFALIATDPEKNLRFHAVCLDKRPIREVMNTVYDSSCDVAFKRAPIFYFYRSWILRISTKGKRTPPQFVKFISSPYAENEQSSVHAKLLKLWYEVDYPLVRPDEEITAPNLSPIRLVTYKTAKRLKKDEKI